MHSLFFQTFLEMGQRSFGGLDFPLQSIPTSRPHSCACAVPCCAHLQELGQGSLSWKSAALLLHGPLFQPYLILSYHVLLSTFLVCYYQQSILGWSHSHPAISVWDISLLSSGLPHWHREERDNTVVTFLYKPQDLRGFTNLSASKYTLKPV